MPCSVLDTEKMLSMEESSLYKVLPSDKGSIRLIHILPDLSHDGLIQSRLEHSNISASYCCLSYVWGDETEEQIILMNGFKVKVRRNLWEFMSIAQTKYSQQSFWIDAVCINQKNIGERNSQVAQMGDIYSRASRVVAWLGSDEALGRAFEFGLEVGELYKDVSLTTVKQIWKARNAQTQGQLKKDWLVVVEHPYWRRAWITQEIIQARQVVLLWRDLEIEPLPISGIARGQLDHINNLPEDVYLDPDHWEPHTRLFGRYMDFMCRQTSFEDNKLIDLLATFPTRLSQYPRDQIYSLLSIASDGSAIRPMYELPIEGVLLQTLHMYHTQMCTCVWSYLSTMLACSVSATHLTEGTISALEVTLRTIQTEPAHGPDIANWHEMCSTCHVKVDLDYAAPHAPVFCLRTICQEFHAIHLYIGKQSGGAGIALVDSHGEPILDLLHMETTSPFEDDVDFLDLEPHFWYRIYFSLEDASKLCSRYSASRKVGSDGSVCFAARTGKATMRFHAEFEVPGSTP